VKHENGHYPGTSDDQEAGEAKRSVVKTVAGWLLVVGGGTRSTERGDDWVGWTRRPDSERTNSLPLDSKGWKSTWSTWPFGALSAMA
jgi:hypothetical protein